MQRDTVEARLRTDPAIEGEIVWTGARLILRPSASLEAASDYTVLLEAGALSESGRQVLNDHSFTFRVRGPRVAYLAPEDGATKDIWLRDATGIEPPERVTHSAHGIAAFDVSPIGGQIVFAERKEGSSAATDLHLLDLDTGAVRPLTNCGEFICTSPVWSPDGRKIAYERLAYSRFEPGISTTSSRVWLLDPETNPPQTRPLFGEARTPPNYHPRWSPDGARLAVSQLPAPPERNPGVLLVQLADESTQFFPTAFGGMAVFSPDGKELLYPGFAVQGGEMQTQFHVAELATEDVRVIPGLAQAHDSQADWRPDGSSLAMTRRAVGEQRFPGRQLYLLQPGQDALQPLLVDGGYDDAYFAWDSTGQMVVLQRAQVWRGEAGEQDKRGQVWTYDVTARQATLLALNAFHPRWVP